MSLHRLTVTLVIGAALSLAATAAHADDRGRQRPGRQRGPQAPAPSTEDTRTFAVGRGSSLDLSNVSGNVRVSVGRGDAIDVRGERRGRGNGADPRVEMSQVGNRVEVRVRHQRSSRSDQSIDFTVTVPADAMVTARSVSGDVALTGGTGDARLESVSGNVTATSVGNLSQAKTVSGNVTVRDATSEVAVTLTSVSGSVTVSGLRARGVDATSVSGRVGLQGVAAQRLTAKSTSGDVEFTGTLASDGRYDLTSHSGDIQLRLPADAAFDLIAETFSGRLSSDFPVTVRGNLGGRGARTLRGVAGSGGAQLSLRSFSGAVTVSRQ